MIITDIAKLKEQGIAETIHPKIDKYNIKKIIKELKEEILTNNLTSLSAPQIGYNVRIFCLNFNGDVRAFVNPVIAKQSGLDISRETDASIPEKEFIIPRNTELNIVYTDEKNIDKKEIKNCKLVGLAAYIFQQEIDHLDKVFLDDFGLEIDAKFNEASDNDKAEIIKLYLESLDKRKKLLEEEIEKSDEKDLTKQTRDAIRFMTSVLAGETKLEPIDQEKDNGKCTSKEDNSKE